MSSIPETRLSRKKLIAFGFPEYAIYLSSIPVSLYIPYVYSTHFGLELAHIGLILMLARITDVITDPLIGYLSDRTGSRFGRRKPWLAGGAVVMMFSAFFLFNPQYEVTNAYLLIWSMLLWLGWTMINIPYYAWGAELSDSYDERTRITGWRQGFAYLGNVTVLALPALAGELTGFGSLPEEGLTIIGSLALIALPATIAVALAFVPERNAYGMAKLSLQSNFKAVWKNGSFKLLWIAFMLKYMGAAWGSALFMLFAAHVVGERENIAAILLGHYALQLIALPMWVKLSAKIGKKETYIIGGTIFSLVIPLFMFVGDGDLVLFIFVLCCVGASGSYFTAISMSMKADVIEIASQRAGENVSGAYIAIWSLGQKMIGALALGICLPLLQYLGFDAQGENGPRELQILSLMYVVPQALMYVGAVAFIWRYPITSKRLQRIRSAFERRSLRINRAPAV
ncbi:MAG: MFS transporter [Pseudomonadales bacterium]